MNYSFHYSFVRKPRSDTAVYPGFINSVLQQKKSSICPIVPWREKKHSFRVYCCIDSPEPCVGKKIFLGEIATKLFEKNFSLIDAALREHLRNHGPVLPVTIWEFDMWYSTETLRPCEGIQNRII